MKIKLLLTVLLFTAAGLSFAGNPPANDTFADAAAITTLSGISERVYLLDASAEPGEPAHSGSTASHSVWWTFTAPSNGVLVLDSWESQASLDTVIGVYTGATVSALGLVAQNDDSPQDIFNDEIHSRVVIGVTAGTAYWIALDGYEGATGAVRLRWNWVPLQSDTNDHFANAIALEGERGVSSAILTADASAEQGEPQPPSADNPPARSVWWSFTSPTNGLFTFDTRYSTKELDNISSGSSLDTTLAVYTGNALTNLSLVSFNDDTPISRLSQVSIDAAQGEPYRITVDGDNGDETG